MIAKLVKQYEDHQEKRLHEISMAAVVVEANILKALKVEDEEESKKLLQYAINDVRYIKDELAKNDFKITEKEGK